MIADGLPRRVAVVSRRVWPAHGPGGMERANHDLVRALASLGLAIDLITETPIEAQRRCAAESAFPEQVRLIWCPAGPLPIGRRRGTVVLDRITNYRLWVRRLAAHLADDVELVHASGFAGAGFTGGVAGRDGCRAMVLVPHGMEEFHSPGWAKHLAYAPFRRGVRRAAAAADVVLAGDEVLRADMQRLLSVPSDRMRVIPNTVDIDACREQADRAAAQRILGSDGKAAGPVFLSIGRLAPNKGFELLAEAFGQVASELPPGWRWVLVGDGPQRQAIEAAVRRAGIAEHCVLAGAVGEPAKYGLLGLADWFVHPTLYEGSSIVTLEAIAHGLPVVGTRAGGLPDKIRDGASGLLVEPNSVDALAQGLRATGGHDAEAWGRASRQLFDERFGWKAVGRRHLELYREVMAARTGSQRRVD